MRASRWWSDDPMTSLTSAPENPLPLDRPRSRRKASGRVIGWLRANLFPSIPSSIISLLLIAVLGKALISLVQWGYVNAIWIVSGDQTGQAIEAIALIMMVFLTISLGISLFMNWYNARIALVER
jgi:hypothetical protein